MVNVTIILFLIIWAMSFLYIGISSISKMLGGSGVYYFLFPLISLIHLKYENLSKWLLWPTILTLTGLVTTNYLTSYYTYNYRTYHPFVMLFVISTSIIFILAGYCYIIILNLLTGKNIECLPNEDVKILKSFFAYVAAAIQLPGWFIAFIILILIDLGKLNNVNQTAYDVALGASIVSGLTLVFGTRKIQIETLNYFSKPLPRLDANPKKIKKWLSIGTLVVLLVSCYLEGYRGYWLTWIGTSISFIIYLYLFYKFGQVILLPVANYNQRPPDMYLPSFKNKKNMIIGVVFLVLYLLIIFIAL